ncbi:MAG: DNA-binding protein YbiB [Methyloversatilis sp.]|nr:DNA-binding protein YbiB [Methyloversatilis sp.]
MLSPQSLTEMLSAIGRGDDARDLAETEAHGLFADMLDGRIPALELGAVLASLRWKHESADELAGFARALNERVPTLELPPHLPRMVVIPSYARAGRAPNLMPLLALMLARLDVPVLVHGLSGGNARPGSLDVLERLGHLPCSTVADALNTLHAGRCAILPTEVLNPALDSLIRLRERMGHRNTAHVVAKLLDPAPLHSLRVICVADAQLLSRLHDMFLRTPERALLMRAPDDDSFADPLRRPRIELFERGSARMLFEAESGALPLTNPLPPGEDIDGTADCIRDMLEGHRAIPQPLLNQLAACLFGSGAARDLTHAKATVSLGLAHTAH